MSRTMLSMSRAMTRRSVRLLDMEYKPSEIAQELNCKPSWVVLAIKHNAPSRKDESGRFWLHGLTFAAWLQTYTAQEKERRHIKPNECYCVGCKKYTSFLPDEELQTRIVGKCPKGHKVSKFKRGKHK